MRRIISGAKRFITVILSLALITGAVVRLDERPVYAAESKADKLKKAFDLTTDYIIGRIDSAISENKSIYDHDWYMLGLARAGKLNGKASSRAKKFYEDVCAYVKENIGSDERIAGSSTANSKLIVILTALGFDPTSVAGHNLVKGLDNLSSVLGQFTTYPSWALIAINSGKYPVPPNSNSKKTVTADIVASKLVSFACKAGGWSVTPKGTAPDLDSTAMVIQSLSRFYGKREDVTNAVDAALNWLSSKMNDEGGLDSSYGESSEAIAQAIVALTSLGIDPDTDKRFVKNGKSLIDGILRFADPKGGFAHTLGGIVNGMATAQSYYALVSYYRFIEGKSALYDMTEKITGTGSIKAPIDSGDAIFEGKSLSWKSSDKSVATVSDGVITGVKAGVAIITASTSSGKSKSCVVEVLEVLPKTIKLDHDSIQLDEGGTVQLKATLTPDNCDKTIYWISSDPEIVSVDKGVLKYKKPGKVTVSAFTVNGLKASCTVISGVPVTKVTLDKTKATIDSGKTCKLTAKVQPTNASDKTIRWSSSNTKIATVKNGVVTGKKGGTVTITAEAFGGAKVTCKVTVRQSVTSIKLNKEKATVNVNKTIKLKATALPKDAVKKTVSWVSKKPEIATVNKKTGLVKGKKAGKAVIVAKTANGVTAKCTVTVKKVAVKKVIIPQRVSLGKGKTKTLKVKFEPADPTNKSVTWKSNKPEVVKVDKNGKIKGMARGNAKITVTSKDGKKMATCRVSVV